MLRLLAKEMVSLVPLVALGVKPPYRTREVV